MEAFIQIIVGISLIHIGYEGYRLLKRLHFMKVLQENSRISSSKNNENGESLNLEEVPDKEVAGQVKALVTLAKSMEKQYEAKKASIAFRESVMKLCLIVFCSTLSIIGAWLIYDSVSSM